MKDIIIVSDFDGTITKKDGLYSFIEKYAKEGWEQIEQDWANGKISSKECLISSFIKTIAIDDSFKNFYETISKKEIDFCIVSDGIDYFINSILKQNGLHDISIISNRGYFRGEFFELEFPNDYSGCLNNAGACKCKVVSDLKQEYKKVVYIGDGVSDYCVANKVDILYAKSRLLDYCKDKGIECISYNSFADIQL